MAKYEKIASFSSFNQRRYSSPWVCRMTEDGKFDFSVRVGVYSGDGREGEAGDLMVFAPVEGTVYGYGQKDYRGNNGFKAFKKWNGEKFVECDKLGREKEV